MMSWTGWQVDMKSEKALRVSLTGMMCALSIALSFLESLMPQFIPVPGAKPGFSNIVTMFAAVILGPKYALGVTLFKSFFALITRGATSFFMSLCGGLLSLAVMLWLFKIKSIKFGYIGIGIICAVFHNAGQLAVAVVILGSTILSITPLLIITGIIFGTVTGVIFGLCLPKLSSSTKKLSRHFSGNAQKR